MRKNKTDESKAIKVFAWPVCHCLKRVTSLPPLLTFCCPCLGREVPLFKCDLPLKSQSCDFFLISVARTQTCSGRLWLLSAVEFLELWSHPRPPAWGWTPYTRWLALTWALSQPAWCFRGTSLLLTKAHPLHSTHPVLSSARSSQQNTCPYYCSGDHGALDPEPLFTLATLIIAQEMMFLLFVLRLMSDIPPREPNAHSHPLAYTHGLGPHRSRCQTSGECRVLWHNLALPLWPSRVAFQHFHVCLACVIGAFRSVAF